MNTHLDMKKVCTGWLPKLLTLLQRANRLNCCQEILEESDADPSNFFDRIVTDDECWVYHYDPLTRMAANIWKKPDEQRPTRPRRQRSAGKLTLIIFWGKCGILFIDYLPRGTTVNGSYYASTFERLRSAILEKRRGKVSRGLLLLHDNPSVHKCNIVQAAIQQTGFVKLNHRPIFQILHRLITTCPQN